MFQLSAFVFSVLALLGATFSPSVVSPIAVVPVKDSIAQGEPPLCPGCANTSSLAAVVEVIPRVVAFSVTTHSVAEHGACHIPVNACVQKKPCKRPVSIEVDTQSFPGGTPPYFSESEVSSTQGDENSWEIWVSETASLGCGQPTINYDILKLYQTNPTTGEPELVLTIQITLACTGCQNIEG